jgi:indole-3-glycerol phosphate synthase/phosphoribosylanthranilate isomerase
MAGAPLQWVGVFADQPAEYVARIAGELGLGVVQLHGNETPDEIAGLRARLPEGTAVWKAHWVRGELPRTVAIGADRVLLDGWAAGRQGGTGQAFDWSLLDSYPERGQVVLAGGLRPDNVSAAARHDTWALDVSSGVESSPGTKDPMLLEQFFSARRRLPGRGDAAE